MLAGGKNRSQRQVGVKEAGDVRSASNVPVEGNPDIPGRIHERGALVGNDHVRLQIVLLVQ